MSWTWGMRSWMCGSWWPGRWMLLPVNCTCAPRVWATHLERIAWWEACQILLPARWGHILFLLEEGNALPVCDITEHPGGVPCSGLWGASDHTCSPHTRGQWHSRGITLQLTQPSITRDTITEWKLACQRELLMLQCLAKLCMFSTYKNSLLTFGSVSFFSYAFNNGTLFLHTFGKRELNPFSPLLNLGLSMS